MNSIIHMNHSDKYKDELGLSLEEKERIEKYRDRENAREALAVLKCIDPEGWEKWYDENVPEGLTFGEITQIVNEYLHGRVLATQDVNYCIEQVEIHPQNKYWQKRLSAAIVYEYGIFHEDILEVCE